MKMSNCATKNSRMNSIKGGECRNPLKKKERERMVEYLCGGRVLGDKDQLRSFEVQGGRKSDRG